MPRDLPCISCPRPVDDLGHTLAKDGHRVGICWRCATGLTADEIFSHLRTALDALLGVQQTGDEA